MVNCHCSPILFLKYTLLFLDSSHSKITFNIYLRGCVLQSIIFLFLFILDWCCFFYLLLQVIIFSYDIYIEIAFINQSVLLYLGLIFWKLGFIILKKFFRSCQFQLLIFIYFEIIFFIYLRLLDLHNLKAFRKNCIMIEEQCL